jgi:hypothetical protein
MYITSLTQLNLIFYNMIYAILTPNAEGMQNKRVNRQEAERKIQALRIT